MEQRRALVGRKVGVVATQVLLVDQLIKSVVRGSLGPCTRPPVSACDQVRFFGKALGVIRIENAGSALGIAQGLWIWTAVASLGVVVSIALSRGSVAGWKRPLASGLLVGGTLGNLADRLVFGRVTDFLSFSWGPDRGIGINGSDLALLAGAVMATASLYRWLFGRVPAGAAGDDLSEAIRVAS